MKFYFLYQLDQMDCGPTCLHMISRHYGKIIKLEKLRSHTEIGKEGVNLLGISNAAEKIGYRSMAVQIPTITLATDAKLPCILHWQQNHFIVLYKVKLNTVQGLAKVGKYNSVSLKTKPNIVTKIEENNKSLIELQMLNVSI